MCSNWRNHRTYDTLYISQIVKVIHRYFTIIHHLSDLPPPCYKYSQPAVLENNSHILYWNRPFLTDKTIDYNIPDIVLVDHTKQTVFVIHLATPFTLNIHKIENEIWQLSLRNYGNSKTSILSP